MKTDFVIYFQTLESLEQLAAGLGCTPDVLRLITAAETRQDLYVEHQIPKRSPRRKSKFRTVWSVREASVVDVLKSFARRFDGFLRNTVPGFPHPAAHGYVRKSSTLTNAAVHCGAPRLLKADIENFFGSITEERLRSEFLSLGIRPAVVHLLVALSTVNGSLALGLPASPLLANLCCRELDKQLSSLADALKCKYTRYADDLAFSGPGDLPTKIEIASELSRQGFTLSSSKFRRTKIGQAHFVTGLSIAQSSPRLPKAMKRRLRQELYFIQKFGLKQHLGAANYSSFQSGINKIDGRIGYVTGVERQLGKQMRTQWRAALQKEKSGPVFAPRVSARSTQVTFFVDETEVETAHGRVLVVAVAAIEELQAVLQLTSTILNAYNADPFAMGRKNKQSKGLHFTDAHEELRSTYIRKLASLPVRAYLAYDLLATRSSYDATYLTLLSALLRNRFVGYDRSIARVVHEQNSVAPSAVAAQIAGVYQDLVQAGSRRPLKAPEVILGKKEEQPCLAVPDFLLGVFAGYATLNAPDVKNTETAQKRFERLRDKYRLIQSIPANRWHTTRKPFVPWQGGNPTL